MTQLSHCARSRNC